MTRHTRPISRLSSFGSPHVRRSFGKVAIRPSIYTFSRPLLVSTLFFPLAPTLHVFDHTPSVRPLHSPFTNHHSLSISHHTSLGRLFHHFRRLSTQASPRTPPRNISADFVLSTRAWPSPPVRLSSPLSLYRFCTFTLVSLPFARPFGAASRHLARQRDKIPR